MLGGGGIRDNLILVRIGGMDPCRSSTFRKKIMFLLIELQTNINFLTELVKPVSFIKLSCCAIMSISDGIQGWS